MKVYFTNAFHVTTVTATLMALHLQCCIQLRGPQCKTWTSWSKSGGGHSKDLSVGAALLLMRTGRENWVCTAWRRLCGDLIEPLSQYIMEPKGRLERNF